MLTIVGGILAIGGSAGFWTYRQSRKEAPIKTREADLVVAETSQQMALGVAVELRKDLERLKVDMKTEREERQKLEGRLSAVVEDLRQRDITIRLTREALQMFSYAWDALTANWQSIRQSDQPPDKPIANIH